MKRLITLLGKTGVSPVRWYLLSLLLLLTIAVASSCGGGGGGGDGGGSSAPPSGGGGGGTTPTLASISIMPANTSANRGATKQFTATGSYSDGTTQDITASVTWSSSDTTIATINNAGLATASSNKSGPVTVTAASGSISGNTQFMVAINLPKTGQTTSYVTGDDGNLQRGVDWPSPRFTTNADTTVTDNLTGLIWGPDAGTPTVGACMGGTNSWQGALDYVACLNTNSYLGYNDWRLPNSKELSSLINYQQANTAAWLNTQGFSNVQQANAYWSSTTYGYPAFAFGAYMYGGAVYPNTKALVVVYVWPVRAGGGAPADLPRTGQTKCYDSSDPPNVNNNVINCTNTGQDGDLKKGVAWLSPRFTDNGNGTVTDNLTGLMWLKDANCINTQYPAFDADGAGGDGKVTWQNALNFVAGINNGTYSNCGAGNTDWRLPNVNELGSLVHAGFIEETCGAAACSTNGAWLNTQGFSNVPVYPSSYYWSSTTYAYATTSARNLFMDGGYMDAFSKTVSSYVWPVRGGQ